MSYGIYCLNFNNEDRKQSMIKRFKDADLPIHFFKGISTQEIKDCYPETKSMSINPWSCMCGHLEMIKYFYETELEYGIFCEDDILIHKDLKQMLPTILDDFNKMNLDVLLLGYLLQFKLLILNK